MSRSIVFIIVAVVIIGGLYFLSTLPKQQPTHTIEVAVPQGAPAGGNAH
jgi:preprotein translocase subunit YajC